MVCITIIRWLASHLSFLGNFFRKTHWEAYCFKHWNSLTSSYKSVTWYTHFQSLFDHGLWHIYKNCYLPSSLFVTSRGNFIVHIPLLIDVLWWFIVFPALLLRHNWTTQTMPSKLISLVQDSSNFCEKLLTFSVPNGNSNISKINGIKYNVSSDRSNILEITLKPQI